MLKVQLQRSTGFPMRIDFECAPGELHILVGPSGSGKTTTLRMCLGLTTPDAGSITYFDNLSMPKDALAIKSRLGVVAQMDTLDPDFTAEENLLVYGRYFGMKDRDIKARIAPLLEFGALTSKAKADMRFGALHISRYRSTHCENSMVKTLRVRMGLTRP